MIGKNLAQEECSWPSKFQGMDFNIIKILSLPFNKVCPPGPFLVPASLTRDIRVVYTRENKSRLIQNVKHSYKWSISVKSRLILEVQMRFVLTTTRACSYVSRDEQIYTSVSVT